ncbi:type II toxin-antitoxin system RelE/ParE family toxin [Asticcacaulis sp.]|uniref:type II toxin-antitoxin system RelE/ParE family toxin n=1 Tax=Asticcacaulis sp. TaxID=1872648 RepID=UPI0026393BE9|nr:type II toxin-antitoxin system RelE/ParE family toxin [Asticcacaulis sp.]
MFTIHKTERFKKWLKGLKDRSAKARIVLRLERVEEGNLGDTKSVGAGVYELRIHTGPGYRVYYARSGEEIILLLCGGDKSSQDADILAARALWEDIQDGKNHAF